MIKPLVPNFSHLKEIISNFQGSPDGIDPLIDALKFRVEKVGRHRFFAKDKDLRGKWVTPGFSGFLITEKYRVQCILLGDKGPLSKTKNIKHSIHVIFTEERIHVYRTLFKSIVFDCLEDAHGFLKTVNLHIQISIKMASFGSFNHRPDLLRISEKKNGKIKVELHEPKCDFDLVKWSEDLPTFLNGMIRIAKYLIEIRDRGFVHADVKRGNILVHENTFYLNDFKLRTPIGYKRDPEKYYTWCSTAEKLGLFTPFTDVYGWAISFGCSLWDYPFFNLVLDKEKLYTDALEKEVWKSLCDQELIPDELMSPKYSHNMETYVVDPRDNIKIHFLFYRFLKKILACDQANLKHYKENPGQPNPLPQVTLEECIIFVEKVR